MKEYYVYILRCADSSYYVGVTNDLQRRLIEHQSDRNPKHYTFSRRPVELLYYELYTYINDAIQREKQLQGWSRAKKEALITGDKQLLKRLASGKNSNNASTAKRRTSMWSNRADHYEGFAPSLKKSTELDTILSLRTSAYISAVLCDLTSI